MKSKRSNNLGFNIALAVVGILTGLKTIIDFVVKWTSCIAAILTIVFIALKLVGTVDWELRLVLSPALAVFSLVVVSWLIEADIHLIFICTVDSSD